MAGSARHAVSPGLLRDADVLAGAGVAAVRACIRTRRAWFPIIRSDPSRTSCTCRRTCACWPTTCNRWTTPAPTRASGIWERVATGGAFAISSRARVTTTWTGRSRTTSCALRSGSASPSAASRAATMPTRRISTAGRRSDPSLLPLAYHPSMLDARAPRRDSFTGMATDERPFCLVYSCHEPHPSFVSPRPFDRMYDPADMPLPEIAPRQRRAAAATKPGGLATGAVRPV